jgi:hypothetical protein
MLDRNPHETKFLGRFGRERQAAARTAPPPRSPRVVHFDDAPSRPRTKHVVRCRVVLDPRPGLGAWEIASLAALDPAVPGDRPPARPETTSANTREKGSYQMPTLTARSVKVVIPLDPKELAGLAAHEGQPRTLLTLRLPDRTLSVDIATKSLRRAIAMIREHGADQTTAIIQGKLVGDAVTEAGLVAQVKTPKAEAAAA